jgi:hypothetical protein
MPSVVAGRRRGDQVKGHTGTDTAVVAFDMMTLPHRAHTGWSLVVRSGSRANKLVPTI